jgi:hypothetical protein
MQSLPGYFGIWLSIFSFLQISGIYRSGKSCSRQTTPSIDSKACRKKGLLPKMNRKQFILNIGMREYIFWLYHNEKDFIIPSMDEMVRHFDRHSKTIKSWLRKLKDSGSIPIRK